MHMETGICDERDNETTDEDSNSDSDISDDEGDVIFQEVGKSSDDDENDSENDKILLPRNSRTGSNVQHIYPAISMETLIDTYTLKGR